MARLPTIRRLTKQQVPDAPAWFDVVINVLNLFLDAVFSALAGNLTFRQNIRSSIRDLRFRTLANYATGDWTELTFPHNLGVRADGVQILQIQATSGAVLTDAVSLDWTELNGEIRVRYIAGLAASTDYSVRLLVI